MQVYLSVFCFHQVRLKLFFQNSIISWQLDKLDSCPSFRNMTLSNLSVLVFMNDGFNCPKFLLTRILRSSHWSFSLKRLQYSSFPVKFAKLLGKLILKSIWEWLPFYTKLLTNSQKSIRWFPKKTVCHLYKN